jgi:tripartite-type tricarboxylate transporter receptor subunit TctC
MNKPIPALLVLAAALAQPLAIGNAPAQAYPNKPIRMIIPFTAGGFSDVVGRIVGQKLAESVGQSVVIDNRPGASGIIGTDIAVKSQPDGYTLLLTSFNHVVNPSLMNPPYDPINDFAAITLIADGPPLVMMVNPSTPVKSIKELVDLARSRPGQLNYGSSGIGTSGHLIGELFKQATASSIVHVAYRGSGASMTAVVSGEVAMVSTYMPVALPQVQAGKLRPLAVTSAKRSRALPDVPTMVESGVPGVVFSGFAGMLAPAGTPGAIVSRLHQEVVKMSKDPDFAKRYAAFDMNPIASTPQELVRFTRDEIAKWAKVIKSAGIRIQK